MNYKIKKILTIITTIGISNFAIAQENNTELTLEKKERNWKLSLTTNYRSLKNVRANEATIIDQATGQFVDGSINKTGGDMHQISISDAEKQKYKDGQNGSYYSFAIANIGGTAAGSSDFSNNRSYGLALERKVYENDKWQLGLKVEFNYLNTDANWGYSSDDFTHYGYRFSKDLNNGNNNENIGINEIEWILNGLVDALPNYESHLKYSLDISFYSFLLGPTLSYNLNDKFSIDSSFGVGLNFVRHKSEVSYTINSKENGKNIRNGSLSDSNTDFLTSLYFQLGITYKINEKWSVSGAYRYEKFLDDLENEYMYAEFDGNSIGLYLNYSF